MNGPRGPDVRYFSISPDILKSFSYLLKSLEVLQSLIDVIVIFNSSSHEIGSNPH